MAVSIIIKALNEEARIGAAIESALANRDRDFDYDPVELDRFRYLMGALKRNGIYWMIDVLTSQNGAIGGVYPDRWEDKHGLKLDVHFDAAARAHWHRLAATLLATPNPYTGLAPLKDPALALLIPVNENGMEFASILEEPRSGRTYPQRLQAPFNAWLQTEEARNRSCTSGALALFPGELCKDRRCITLLRPIMRHAGKEGFMSAIQRWVERDDAKLAEKSTSWFVLRSFFGVLVLVKAAHFALTATGPFGYVLAALFIAGGLAWLIEGAQGVRARLSQKV